MGKVIAVGMVAMVAVIVGYVWLHTPLPNSNQSLVPSIVAPADGAAVQGPVQVQIQYPESGATLGGHIHLLVDVDPPKPGEIVPMDEQHLHLMNFEKDAVLELPPGEHRLQLLLGTPDHRVPNPPVLSKAVRITVLPRP